MLCFLYVSFSVSLYFVVLETSEYDTKSCSNKLTFFLFSDNFPSFLGSKSEKCTFFQMFTTQFTDTVSPYISDTTFSRFNFFGGDLPFLYGRG